jgi:membrane dipeptidase
MKTNKMTRGKFLGTSLGLTVLSSTGLKGSVLGRLMEQKHGDFYVTENMKRDYEVALSILKPTQAQLEHGLELHRDSLIWEPYGFMPKAAIDGTAYAHAINDNASALELGDMHENMRMTRFVDNERERKEFENAWKASGVTCVGQNAGAEGNAIDLLLKRLSNFTYSTDMMRDFIVKAVTPDDVVKAKEENRHALYLTGNGVPLPEDWVSVEEELRYIKVFFQLGIRMMHLTYNRRNQIGDGCGEPANGGLSDFGRAVVKEMNRVGVIVDIAHSGWKTSLEAIKLSEKPAVASHSIATSIHNVIRSKPDEVIRALADTGGFIGICVIPRFLGGTGDIAAMMKHLDYVVKNFGPDYAAIATDTAYSSQYGDEEYKKVKELTTRPENKARNRWEALWPPEPFETTPEMKQSTAWTNFPLFTVGMVQMGYSDKDIQKILGGNVLRVAKAALA